MKQLLPLAPAMGSVLATCLLLAAPGPEVTAAMPATPVEASALEGDPRKKLMTLLSKEVHNALARQSSAETSRGIRLDARTNAVVVELSVAYLPQGMSHMSAELQDRLHEITTGVVTLVVDDLGLSISGVSYTFDGQPLPFHYPGDFAEEGATSGWTREFATDR